MGSENLTFASTLSSAVQENPSEYVKLEADLIAREDSELSAEKDRFRKKTILIYCRFYTLLIEISNELKSKLGTDVEILITTEKQIALRLLKSGDVDLLLQGPVSEKSLFINVDTPDTTKLATGSALIFTQSSNPGLEAWMKSNDHSQLLTHAVIRLNEQAAF